LHPNDAGHKVLAASFDLRLFAITASDKPAVR
jgi:hypothetical protein